MEEKLERENGKKFLKTPFSFMMTKDHVYNAENDNAIRTDKPEKNRNSVELSNPEISYIDAYTSFFTNNVGSPTKAMKGAIDAIPNSSVKAIRITKN